MDEVSSIKSTTDLASETEGFDLIGIPVPDLIRDLYKNPPLLKHEDPKIYWQLVRCLAQEKQPQDLSDWFLVMDLVYQVWNSVRSQGFSAALIEIGQRAALAEILAPVGKAIAGDGEFDDAWDDARKLSEKHFEAKGKKEVEKRLNKYGLDQTSIAAASFARLLPTLETSERMLAAFEIRRRHTTEAYEDRRARIGHAPISLAPAAVEDSGSSPEPRKEAAE